jgi:hypothetical protein
MAAYTTIDNPELYFQTVLYTGNGAANHAITLPGDEDMQPDMVWIKNRDATDDHCLFDAVRGATKVWYPNQDHDVDTDADTLDSFTSDGFQVDADVKVNTNTEKYVAWCWKAGTTSGIAGSPGITPESYSFNQTSGFSIVRYVGSNTGGDTIPHGLGAVPNWIVTKCQSADNEEGLNGHTFMNGGVDPYDYGMGFPYTGASYNSVGYWHDTAPTSTLVSLGVGGGSNLSGQTYMLYAWTDIQGFSKFGMYEGNGNADGTFVYTGFRPAYVMIKSADSTSAWHIFDNKREGYNVDNDALEINTTTVEATADQIDLLSNGFKCRIATDPNVAETYLYSAFAEAPFVNSNGVPCNAR